MDLAVKKEQDEAQKRLHPMFRRTSTTSSLSSAPRSSSRSVSVEVKPKGRCGMKRKVSREGKSKGIKEEPVEISDSDDDLKPSMAAKKIKLEDGQQDVDDGVVAVADGAGLSNANR